MVEQLNNQKFIQQCKRIKDLISKVSLTEAGPGNGFIYDFPESVKTYEEELMYSSE